ncbi:uncharacterized mitochondrial protein AtMg00810-like [Beta vulgaris subsp. vulgaris]|uniref:uncharacterized mitochondrial protein AtMg00810-like n=1 Tax=Beta vulgaris subsp. vulgaris TaxID=3555 RepID=UPI0020372CF2|nr:uncharacterized mitochondrial protein AtMg00810-like [Beta vulgaris subsp. vulgaris]
MQPPLELTKFLFALGFIQSMYDYSMFILQHGDTYTIVVAYADDLLVAGTHLSQIQHLKYKLHAEFTIKDLGPLKYFLDIEVTRDSSGILLNQRNQFLCAPRVPHFLVAQHVLKYVNNTLHHDWGSCMDSSKSLTSYCIFLGTSLISWKTKKQKSCF